MGIFDQAKLAANLMKNMNPLQMKEMMADAKNAQKMMEGEIRRIVEEEIEKRNLVSREEIEEMIRKIQN